MSLHVAISGWLLDPAPSGANRRLLALLHDLPAQLRPDERVTVLHRPEFAPTVTAPNLVWVPVRIPAGPTLRRSLAERRHLPKLLTALGVHLLDHGFLPAPAVPCRLCLLVHDVRDADGEGSRPRWIGRAALRRAADRADAFVVPSEFTAARLRHHVPDAPRIHIVGNGASMPPAPPPADAGSYVLHVGHLERRKNLGLLLQALAALPAAERPQLRLVGRDAGTGGELREQAERLQLGEAVQFLGVVPDALLPALYAGARAVVVPSRYEGYGLCAAEGLAAGRPVLVAAAGALPELRGVHVLPPDDATAWAQAMRSPPPPAPVPPPFDLAARTLAAWRSLAAVRT